MGEIAQRQAVRAANAPQPIAWDAYRAALISSGLVAERAALRREKAGATREKS